jgi:4-diphosphocytidyl-2-C-methyl-D-erythritol kinase
MHVRRFATHVEVLAPAKINLFLEVLARRSDGYHEIETVIAPVTLYDTLVFAPTVGGEIEVRSRWAAGLSALGARLSQEGTAARELLFGEIPSDKDNLAWRAAALLRERAGIQVGASMELVKRIPAAAGLGGASSDAAAALVAGILSWGLNWPTTRLAELAAELGSDVPFFLERGGAVCRGRGERIEPISLPRLHIVVVRPPVGLSTPRVYQHCQPSSQPCGASGLVKALARGRVAEVARRMVNDLQPAASQLTPWIRTLEQMFDQHDLVGHQMSGSGSSYFGLCRSHRHARRVAARMRARRVGVTQLAATAGR